MKDKRQQLRKELKSGGAKPSEVESLVMIAEQLRLLKKPSPTVSQKPLWQRALPFASTGLASFMIGIFLVASSESVMPSSFLFPVQRLSDEVAINIHPEYRGRVMMKRVQQVKLLVANKASSQDILATLNDYQSVASEYSFTSSDRKVLEFCKVSLTQAADMAQGADKQAITNVLDSFNNV